MKSLISKKPKGLALRLKEKIDLGKASFKNIYKEMFGVDYSVEGFDAGRFSAKLEFQVSHKEEDEKPGEFDGYFVVKSLDGGIKRFLAPRDKVHIPDRKISSE